MLPLVALMLLTAKSPAAGVTPVELPPYEETRLDNGLRIVVAPRKQLPLASVELLLETGSADDPEGKAGLASFTAGLLRRGTESRSADEIVGAIEYVGGSLDAAAGPDASTVTASVTSENLPLALELVADVALHPSFPKNEFELHKRRVIAELAQELDDPGVVADRVMLRSILPDDHPYAEPTSGTRTSVATFKRSDLQKFHARHFVPARATLIVVGDVDPQEVRKLAKKHFGSWSGGTAQEAPVQRPALPKRNRILVIHKDQASQVQVRIVGLAFPEKTDPAYFPATVANGAFGGGFTSRLVDEIRVNRGLSYNANSRFVQLQGAGFFVFKSFTKNETVGELLKVTLGEAEKAREAGFRPDEIARAQNYLTGLYPLRLETNDQIAAALGEMLLYGLPNDWVSKYRERLAEVTPAQANEAARDWFFAKPWGMVLVGDQAAIKRGLKAAGVTGQIETMRIEEL